LVFRGHVPRTGVPGETVPPCCPASVPTGHRLRPAHPVCSGTGGGSTTILRTLTAQFLHQGAHALVLDHTRIAHLWAKDLPTVTDRGNVAGIHDALVGLGSELERRTALDGDLAGVPRLMVVIDRADDTLRHLARYWETFRQENDPKRSPAIAALEAVLYEGRAARIHVIYDGPATTGSRLIPGAEPAPGPRARRPGGRRPPGSGAAHDRRRSRRLAHRHGGRRELTRLGHHGPWGGQPSPGPGMTKVIPVVSGAGQTGRRDDLRRSGPGAA
jgi:hypothetical protein